MNSKILPLELLDLTNEYHFAQHSKGWRYIYITLVISLLVFMSLLPFLFVEVSVKCPGTLKAATELNILKANSTGLVRKVFD